MENEIKIKPIGYFRSPFKNFLEAPRQATHDVKDSFIELEKGQQLELGLSDLDGFDRIWVIFQFHLKDSWRPLVQPPRGSKEKRGVFSTRSPLRPNQLGLSCLKLEKIDKNKVFVSGSDLLDGTPIFDIKPYLPYCDSFPHAQTGWLEGIESQRWNLFWSNKAQTQAEWLENKNIPIKTIIQNQLEFDPTNSERKRVTPANEENEWVFAYRTWRLSYRVSPKDQKVEILEIFTGYTPEELQDPSDKYKDKALHREFQQLS